MSSESHPSAQVASGQLVVERPADVEAFLARGGAFLAAREAENNLLFGICANLRLYPSIFREPPRFAIVTRAADEAIVLGAALQTPPHRLVLAAGDDDAALDALADGLAGVPLPGVVGPKAAARRFAERWSARSGQRLGPGMAERIFRCSEVRPPRPASGGMRIAGTADRGQIVAWLRAFTEEALGETFEDAEAASDRWIARAGRTLYLWQDGEATVSMCGAGGATPTGIRIGPVYTPPEHRGHGYASNLVASASTTELQAGHQFLFLFTDLANPTSNGIYQAIGYRPVIDVDQYTFSDA